MDRVRVLLRTRNDYLPGPKSQATGALSGPAPGRNVVCPDCRGSGRATRFQGLLGSRVCASCLGDGERRRVGAEPAYDSYVQATVGDESTTQRQTRSMTPRELDASIAHIDALFAEREGHHEHETFAWERARRARDRSGSYPEVEYLLGVMPDHFAHVIHVVYDVDIPGAATVAPDLEALAVRWIAERMPRNIRIPEWAYQDETERLRAQIREELKSLAPREVAEHLGLSLHRVKALIRAQVSPRTVR